MSEPGKVIDGRSIGRAADLVSLIEERIVRGELAPGDRLDPVRSVATEFGLAPNTVAAAYRTLGDRGLLIGRGRRGTFVAPRPSVATPADNAVPEGLIDLASGNPDPDLLPALAPALATIDTGHELYGAPSVDPGLASLLVANLAADGIDATNLAVVGGALDGLERILEAHLRHGDSVALEDPGYPAVAELVAAMGLRAVPVAIDACGPRPDSLERAIAVGIDAIVITPRAQNPTGAAVGEARATELAAVLHRADAAELLVIEDDHAGAVAGWPYQHLCGPERARWATVRSMAKSLGPDLRVAALVGDATTIGRVRGRQVLGPGWVSHLLQRVVAAQLASEQVTAQLAEAAEVYTRRRAVVVEGLTAAGIDVTAARSGLNVWVPVDDETQVVAAMERYGFAVRAGARFRRRSPSAIRLSVAGSDDETLRRAVAALIEISAERPPARSV